MNNQNDLNNNYNGNSNSYARNTYEKFKTQPNSSIAISLSIMIIASIVYFFIVASPSFNFNFASSKNELANKTQSITNDEISLIDDNDTSVIDNIDIDTLTVIDTTNTSSEDLVVNASYTIDELDYSRDSFIVPYINIKSDDAAKVNEEIKNNYKIWAKESAKYKTAFSSTSLDSSKLIRSSYETYTFENVLSVVITFVTREESLEAYKYYAYAFNTSNESLLITDTSQIMSLAGPGEELTMDMIESAVTTDEKNYGKLLSLQELFAKIHSSYEVIDTKYKEILTTYSGEYGALDNIEDTIALYREEYENGTLNAFIDSEGRLTLISKIFTPLYENGTYRMFRYNNAEFEAVISTSNSNSEEVKNETKK